MPELNALYLASAVVLIAVMTHHFRMMAFLALALAAACYGLALGSALPWVAKEFNMGFGQTLAATGLAILGGAMLARAMEAKGGARWLQASLPARRRLGLATGLGALAGLGGTPIAALAVLAPLSAAAGTARSRIALAATHAVTACHGSLVPSPLPIAALAILGGDWRWGLAAGVPVAAAQLGLGVAAARRAPDTMGEDPAEAAPCPPSPRAAWAALLGVLVMIGLIIGHSLGQIPSEPFGGGNPRENILGLGRPLILLLAGLGLALAAMGALDRRSLAEDGWLADGARRSVGIMLAVGAAGGFQMSLHNTGMAPLLAERLQELPPALGVVIPFLMALLSRVLQGSALTAVITAAGIMQPMLAPLGLESEPGRALAAVAVGVGAMAVPHMNDGYFWLAAHRAGLRPLHALGRVTGTSLIQGLGGLIVLMALRAVL